MSKIKCKRLCVMLTLSLLLVCMMGTTAFAAGTGDVAGAVESTWATASTQIKTVVNNVVFPAIDLILAVFFFAKLGTAYFDYRKSGQFEWTAPAILFACLVFTLTAPLYIWQIIVGEQYPDATYVGRACYVRLSDMNRAKIQFVTGSVANQYNALQMTILNRSEGQVDTLRLRFSDLLGTKVTSNPNFRNGVDPHIWDDYGKVDWYVYHPTRQDYEKLSNAVSDYLEVFQDMSQSADQQWAQTM